MIQNEDLYILRKMLKNKQLNNKSFKSESNIIDELEIDKYEKSNDDGYVWPYPEISLERIYPLNSVPLWECCIIHEDIEYGRYTRNESYTEALKTGILAWNNWVKENKGGI